MLFRSISGRFMGYSTQFLAPGTISTASDPKYTKIGTSTKLADLVIFGRFLWAIACNFWLRGRFQRLVTPGTRKLGHRQNSSIWSFLAVFVGYIAHSFWLRGRFQWLVTPGTRKLVRHKNSSIWSFLAVFVGYST